MISLKNLFYFKKTIYKLSVCTIIKDKNAYLAEWINYHLKIGVEHFYFYDNESKIPISESLAQLGLSNVATVINIAGITQQVNAYNNCIKKFGATSQWMGFIDMDEFIVPKTTTNLAEFLEPYKPYGGLGINWLVFGSSGHITKPAAPLLKSFQLRSENDFHVNRHIKSIVQPRYVRRARGAHSFKYTKGKFCVNENFEPIENDFIDVSVNKIQLNHYYCRSLEEYEQKIKRGIADTDRLRKVEEFHAHDKDSNKVLDTTICDIFKD